MIWIDRDELERSCRMGAEYYYLGSHIGMCRILEKFKFFVDTRDISLAPHLIRDGYWESWVTMAISTRIQTGFNCIDVGSNFGYYSLLMASLAGTDGHVLAVEANANLCNLLRKSININGMDQLIDVQNTLAWNKGMITQRFFCNPEMMGSSMVLGDDEQITGNLFVSELTTSTLDELVPAGDVVDFIKIDAEGSEPNIIAGASRIIKENKDIQILFEWSPDHPDFTEDWINGLLDEYDFILKKIDGMGRFVPVVELPETLEMLLIEKE